MGGVKKGCEKSAFSGKQIRTVLLDYFWITATLRKVQQCVIVDLSVPAAPSNERGGGFFCSPVRPSSLQVFKWGGGGGAGSSTLKFHFSPE